MTATSTTSVSGQQAAVRSNGNIKYFVGGLFVLGAIIYLIISSSVQNGQFFLTIDETVARAKSDASIYTREIKVAGAVLGDSIQYDPANNLKLTFTMVQVPADPQEVDRLGGLAAVLHEAVIDPTRARLQVVYYGPKPDLLRNEAQAIVTGKLGKDGILYANEGADALLLKCPTRYEEAVPNQAK